MKKQGITLIALTITVLVMIILGSAAVGSVIGLVNVARVDGYETSSKIVREQVDVLYTEIMSHKDEEHNFYEAFNDKYSAILGPTQKITKTDYNAAVNVVANRLDMTASEVKNLDYYVFDSEEAKEILGIADIEIDFLVNFEYNIVFSINPIKYKGEDVYTVEEVDEKFLVTKRSLGMGDVKIGDIIIYDPTAGVTDQSLLTYTSPIGEGGKNYISGNGDREIIFTAVSDDNQYIVLGKENGRLKLVKKNISTMDSLRLRGERGFLFSEKELHKASSVYGHGLGADTSIITKYKVGHLISDSDIEVIESLKGSGARSINIDDIQKITTVPLRSNSTETFDVELAYPSLNGNATGRSSRTIKTFPINLDKTLKTSFNFKTEFNNLKLNDIFLPYEYFLADKAVSFLEELPSGGFNRVRFGSTTVTSTVLKVPTVVSFSSGYNGVNKSYSTNTITARIRPVVFLRPGVKLDKIDNIDGRSAWKVLY